MPLLLPNPEHPMILKTSLLNAALLAICAAPAAALADGATWYADYDEAVAVAKEQGKALFVDFTGSDWCSWCHKLDAEVFAHDAFLEPAQESFVLVALDFPNGAEAKAAVPNPERNQELLEKHGVRGFPTCLLMSTEGDVFGRMGYQEGGPEKYVEDMHATLKEGKRLLAELKTLEADYAAAEDKVPVLTRAVDLLGGMSAESIGVSIVSGMAREALALEGERHAGLHIAAMKGLLGAGQADEALQEKALARDQDNALGLREMVVEARFGTVRDDASAKAAIAALQGLLELDTWHDTDQVKFMTAMAAMWSNGPLQDPDQAKMFAERANRIEGELDPGLQGMLDGILQ